MKNIFSLSIILISVGLLGCSKFDFKENESYTLLGTLIRVNSYTVNCQGIIPMRCMLVQDDDKIGTEDWEYFYQTIQGFDYEEGFIYDLDVKIITIENPPADASSLQYQLIKLIEKYNPDS